MIEHGQRFRAEVQADAQRPFYVVPAGLDELVETSGERLIVTG
jgi:hypothetical protein